MIEELHNVGIPHAHAAMAGRGADQPLLVRAVDVDVALAGIGVFRIQPVEPEDAGEDFVLLAAFFRNLAGRKPGLENRARRGTVANLLGDAKSPGGRLVAAGFRPQPEPRRGNGIGGDDPAAETSSMTWRFTSTRRPGAKGYWTSGSTEFIFLVLSYVSKLSCCSSRRNRRRGNRNA